MSLIRRSLTSTLLIAALYIALDAIVVFLFNPIQFHVLPEISPYSSLIYLPFALRVFGTSLLGKEAIPGLFIGMGELQVRQVRHQQLLVRLALLDQLELSL